MDTTWRPNVEISPNCPRCGSSDTKFCYYNNYSLTQPRYFCKGCRRYWTKGGSLRNVPVGGGCRKSRRAKPWRFPPPTTDHHHHHHHYSSSLLARYPAAGCGATTGILTNDDSVQPLTAAAAADGSHIDLALVYANYLNPATKPGAGITSTDYQIPELGNEFGGSPNLDVDGANNYQLQGAESTTVALLSGVDDHVHGYVLPPLPGEEDIFWASFEEPADFGADLQHPNDLSSFANWSCTVDLSSNATFSKT